MDDPALVTACADGADLAWREFDARFRPVLLASARRVLARSGVPSPDAEAEEVASQVVAELAGGDRRILRRAALGPAPVRLWLWILAAQRARRSLRERRLGVPPPERAPSPTPEEEAIRREDLDRLRGGMDLLPARDRFLLTLFHLDGQGIATIAAILGMSATNVGVALARARKKLRDLL
ncbi:MAG: sigma-70 family RNA polymerase sigma factor [Planctomycetes bacterium]|nr:sigma-70 family RNA polymerase sigma factor [Planctomycetota bacterium]